VSQTPAMASGWKAFRRKRTLAHGRKLRLPSGNWKTNSAARMTLTPKRRTAASPSLRSRSVLGREAGCWCCGTVSKDYERLTERLKTFAGAWCLQRQGHHSRTAYLVSSLIGDALPVQLHSRSTSPTASSLSHYCYQSQWLVRVPPVVKMTADPSPTSR